MMLVSWWLKKVRNGDAVSHFLTAPEWWKICKLLVFYCLEGNEEVVLVVHPKSEFWAGMWLTPVAQSGLFGTWLPLGTTLPPPAPTAGGKSNIRLLENHWVESLWFLTAWKNKKLRWELSHTVLSYSTTSAHRGQNKGLVVLGGNCKNRLPHFASVFETGTVFWKKGNK